MQMQCQGLSNSTFLIDFKLSFMLDERKGIEFLFKFIAYKYNWWLVTCKIRLYCTQSILIPRADPTRWTKKRREDRAKR